MAAFQRYLSACVLMVWGSVLCWVFLSGRVASYLHPNFQPLTVVCGAVLIVLAFVLVMVRGDETGGACANSMMATKAGSVFASCVLVVPLLVGLRSSPSEFGMTAIINRGFVESVSQLPGRLVPMPADPLPGEDPSLAGEFFDASAYLQKNEAGQLVVEAIDLLYAAQEPTMLKDFDSEEVAVVGQFMPATTNNPSGDRFNLVRMFMLCCAADAQPIAVAVEAPGLEAFPDLTWVKVTGTAKFPVEGGKRIPVIDAQNVERTSPPREIFLY